MILNLTRQFQTISSFINKNQHFTNNDFVYLLIQLKIKLLQKGNFKNTRLVSIFYLLLQIYQIKYIKPINLKHLIFLDFNVGVIQQYYSLKYVLTGRCQNSTVTVLHGCHFSTEWHCRTEWQFSTEWHFSTDSHFCTASL